MTYINEVHRHSYVHVSTHRNVYIYSSIALNSNSQTLLDKQRYLNQTILFIIVEYNKSTISTCSIRHVSIGVLLRKVDEIMSLCQNMIGLMEYFSSHIYTSSAH